MDHAAFLKQQFRAQEDPGAAEIASYVGTNHTYYGLKVPVRRKIVTDWIKQHKDISYDDWLTLIDRLYHGESYEEKTAPEALLAKFPKYRRQLPLEELYKWLGELTGWAEVDHTCQSVFTADEMLTRWDTWQSFLHRLSQDDNISRQRASLVLLGKPLGQSDDFRLLHQALEHVELLKGKRDKLIIKAISWVLRDAIKYHRQAIETYLQQNATTLPKVAVRETRQKLDTGTKG